MLSRPGIYILLVVLLLLLGIIFLYVVIKKARRAPAAPEAAPGAGDGKPAQLSLNASGVGLKLSFSKALRRIRAYGKGARYRIPWYLMLGETDSGKTTLLSETGMELLFSAPDEQQTGVKQGLNWFFFNQGIVLDVAGDFVLRADGATSNVKGWNYLLKLLRRYRSERPLDGIILTIPCSDLMGGSSQTPEFKLRLEQKAQLLYGKLVDAQKRLGLSLPVYVLVTKCDEISGFKSLCHEIPERLDEMFGWSNPYTREVAYRAEWVTEAFQNVHSYLFQLQIEIFAEHDRIMKSDDFFMMPSEMRLMRAPLQIYLDQIFKESAYHDPFFLRGIYFCGDGAGEAPAAASAVVVKAAEPEIAWSLTRPDASQAIVVAAATKPVTVPEQKHAFLEHLFERKIFQEELLARPLSRTTLSRNRLVLAAQVLSLAIPLIGVIGILATYPSLKEREATFYTHLAREEQDLKTIEAEKESGFTADQTRNRESQLFEAMQNMNGKSLSSPFIPGSWFSHVKEESDYSISSAYQFEIYDTLRRRLDCRTESKLTALPSSATCYSTIGVNPEMILSKCAVENDYSSKSVHTFIESLDELIQNRARYNRFVRDDSGDLDDLNYLLRYFDHAPVPANFDIHNGLFVQALRMSERPPLRSTDQSVYDRGACKVQGLIQEIYDRTFKNHSVSYDYLGDITKTEMLLARPENAWLANRDFEPPSPFAPMTFAAGVSELKRALNDLAKEKFMSREGAPLPDTSSETQPEFSHQSYSALVWDKATLQQAIDLYIEYDNFVRNNSYGRRDTLDIKVRQAALNTFRQKLAALIARAPRRQTAQPMPGESARKASINLEIKNLMDAQDLLSKLLDICRTPGLDVGLRNMVINQTASLMKRIDDEFYAGGFYATRRDEFSWWTLETTFHSYTVFSVSNADELEVYLATQREGIAELARQYAAPVLGFTSAQNISLRSSVNWKEILEQLDKYDAKKPGSTIAVLENFIRNEMDKVKLDNCDAIVNSSVLLPLDYFIEVRNSLRRPFYSRCQVLAEAEIERIRHLALDNERIAREQKEDAFYNGLKSYTDIQEKFNGTLAGKFPFSTLPESETFEEATPEEIKAFFELLTKNKDAARSILQEAPNYKIQPKAALDFLDQMEKVGSFFDLFLKEKQLSPAFDFNLRFRSKVIGFNQVIDWAFDVGTKRFRYRDINPAGVWTYGAPLSLSLRWANDSPTIPASKFDPLSHMKLEGQTLKLTYGNKWSLLLLMLQHRLVGVDIEPYTLRIEVPTQPNAKLSNQLQRAQREELRTPSVEVFMGIGLTAPDKQEPLFLPDVFPTRAPQLTNRSTVIQQSRERRIN
jgi:hypothetical protein